MIYFVALSVAVAVGLIVAALAQVIAPARPAVVGQRLTEVRNLDGSGLERLEERRHRQEQREKLESLLEVLGRRLQSGSTSSRDDLLVHAGYRSQRAPAVLWGSRVLAALVLGGFALLAVPILGGSRAATLLASFYMAAMGWLIPLFYVRSKARARQKDVQLALADALDLLVVCAEAGLGLNQAMVRVADEIAHVSEAMAEELHLVNLEIRAGQPREEALKHLFQRTGVEDVRALVTMLIQADRFGTSIGRALRVQAETLREKRRQRAEEAAAKTTIKLVFPLVLCIFPAMFVVLVGPGLIQIVEAISGIG